MLKTEFSNLLTFNLLSFKSFSKDLEIMVKSDISPLAAEKKNDKS